MSLELPENTSRKLDAGNRIITNVANGVAATDVGVFGQIPIITAWASYTPVFQGFGTVVSISMYWRRIGDTTEIKGQFTAGTSTAVELRIGLPSVTTGNATRQLVGTMVANTAVNLNATEPWSVLADNGKTYLNVAKQGVGINPYVPAPDNGSVTDSVIYTLYAAVQISGWNVTS